MDAIFSLERCRLTLAVALARFGELVARGMDRRPWLCLAPAVLLATLQAGYAKVTPLWLDECFTLYISQLPNLREMMQTLPMDGQPPLGYLINRVSLAALGQTELALRLPSVLAFTVAGLTVYLFVHRRTNAVFALFAMAILFGCRFHQYAHEARPYALLLCFTGLTLACWQAAAAPCRRRFLSLAGVTAGVFCAICTHHYGVLHVGVPLVLGEGARLLKRRRPDFGMYLAIAAGLSAFAVTFPLMRQTQVVLGPYVRQSTVFWAKPRLSNLATYGNTLPLFLPAIVLTVLVLLLPVLLQRRPVATEDPSPAPYVPQFHEICAAVGLALLPPITILLMHLSTGCFVGRHVVGASIGIALLIGLALPRVDLPPVSMRSIVSVCAVCLLAVSFGADLFDIWKVVQTREPVPHVLENLPGADPVVIASAGQYFPIWHYAPPELRNRLHYLSDRDYAVRQTDFVPELALSSIQAHVPVKVSNYRQFLSAHPRFLLYCANQPVLEWTRDRLLSEGWRSKLIRTAGNSALYLVQEPGTSVER